MIQRNDDREKTVRTRLSIYYEQTEPRVNFYTSRAKAGGENAPEYEKVEGIGSVNDIRDRGFNALGA